MKEREACHGRVIGLFEGKLSCKEGADGSFGERFGGGGANSQEKRRG
jgi:hypothetical protein